MKQQERKVSVVLADDHPLVLGGLKSLLDADGGFAIETSVSNGLETVEALRRLEPDLAVLDIQMPGLTGIEVLQAVEDDGLRTRIVFLTATASDEQIHRAVTHGAWGIMLKDAAADSLIECLRKVSSGERWLPPELVSPALHRESERRSDIDRVENLLTPREHEITLLVAQGLSNKQIARQTNISEGTVKIHLHNAYQKLRVSNRTALAGLAQRHLVQRS